MPTLAEPIDIKKEIRRKVLKDNASETDISFWNGQGRLHNAESSFFNPFALADNAFGNIRTISRIQYGGISCRVLREVAKKAWIINVCIGHTIKKIKPFLKPSTDKNIRGFVIIKKGDILGKQQPNDKEREKIENFLMSTGNYDDPERDNFTKYCSKILRDLFTIDQIATEVQYDKKGDPIAFFAVDAATIERVLPEVQEKAENDMPYKYLQVIDGMPCAAYTTQNMLFDFENPRTDIYHSMYGYSYVEQAVDLVTSTINTFMYNAGNFTENKLPKGMLLIDGDASPETVEQMEDYIAEIMSGGPLNQWRIPIIPSGSTKGEGGGIKWQQMLGNNREMEFQGWLDYLTSGVVAMFGCTIDELGIQSQKSQAVFERQGQAQISSSKALILGDTLGFLESYLNRIVNILNPDYRLEFVGYEKDDPKIIADLDKQEVETWKTLNEKREEKGLPKLDLSKIDNGADIPLNPQFVQIFQSAQMNKQQDQGGEGGGDSWEDYGNMQMGDDEVNADETTPDEEGGGEEENDAENEEPTEEQPEQQEEENDAEIGKSLLLI